MGIVPVFAQNLLETDTNTWQRKAIFLKLPNKNGEKEEVTQLVMNFGLFNRTS